MVAELMGEGRILRNQEYIFPLSPRFLAQQRVKISPSIAFRDANPQKILA